MNKLIESLSPLERKILPFLHEKSVKKIMQKSELDETSVLRALQFLQNKDIVTLSEEKEKIVDLGDNGVNYLKIGLPERRLLNLLAEKKSINLQEKIAKISENEFKAAIGALKKKAMIELKDGKIILIATMREVTGKMLEEQLIEKLPIKYSQLQPEQLHALKALESRKDIISVEEKKNISIQITPTGSEIIKSSQGLGDNLIEALTPEMLRSDDWKNKKFRRYDISSPVPAISGGKRHFVNQAIDYARKIWTELGFKEMPGDLVQTGFWNFDALFTAQDHPVREMQDTFYIKDIQGKLPEKEVWKAVKASHEGQIQGSKGWQYQWDEKEPSKVILRTHTTCLSAKTLASLRSLKTNQKQGKFFAIGKCFRNETVDWGHGFEFNQTEGIVIDKNANFRNLLGYLSEFFKKMGFEQIKFVPSYFPYTEPSVEIYGFMKEKKIWIEIGGAGMFRPEVTIPLLGEHIPVLAWGPGFDRSIMNYYNIQDLREMYSNDLTKLRKMKFWTK